MVEHCADGCQSRQCRDERSSQLTGMERVLLPGRSEKTSQMEKKWRWVAVLCSSSRTLLLRSPDLISVGH